MSNIEKVLVDRGFVAHRGDYGKWEPIDAKTATFFSTAQGGCLYNVWLHPDGRYALYGIGEDFAMGLIQPLTPNGLQALIRMEQEHGAEAVVDFAFANGWPTHLDQTRHKK